MGEEWRRYPVDPTFEVSTLGRIRGRSGRIIAGHRSGKNYLRVGIAGGTKWDIHRMVLMTFVGPPAPRQICRHLNGNPKDNRLVNLAWGSFAENNLDAVRHGTHPKAKKTRCPSGHPYSGDNLVVYSVGRRCRICVRDLPAERRRLARMEMSRG